MNIINIIIEIFEILIYPIVHLGFPLTGQMLEFKSQVEDVFSIFMIDDKFIISVIVLFSISVGTAVARKILNFIFSHKK